jgi:hypothetical protein
VPRERRLGAVGATWRRPRHRGRSPANARTRAG